MNKSIMTDTDAALDRAAEAETKFVATGDTAEKKKANMYFKRAMKNDGNENCADEII